VLNGIDYTGWAYGLRKTLLVVTILSDAPIVALLTLVTKLRNVLIATLGICVRIFTAKDDGTRRQASAGLAGTQVNVRRYKQTIVFVSKPTPS
jgi:hypothetical protein